MSLRVSKDNEQALQSISKEQFMNSTKKKKSSLIRAIYFKATIEQEGVLGKEKRRFKTSFLKLFLSLPSASKLHYNLSKNILSAKK